MDGIIIDYRKEDGMLLGHGARIAHQFNVPMFYLRTPKKHGLKKTIEGDLNVLRKCKDIIFISRLSPQETNQK